MSDILKKIQIPEPVEENVEKIEEVILPLTEPQKSAILKIWNDSPENKPPSVKDITDKVFWVGLDARSKQARMVREYLATLGMKLKPIVPYDKMEKIVLTPEQKEFIGKNCPVMTTVEMARILFEKPKLTNLDLESRAVVDYFKTLPKEVQFAAGDDVPEGNYRSPKSEEHCIARINKYVPGAIPKDEYVKNNKLQIYVQTTIKFLHKHRFILMMNNFISERDRTLFESSFVSYVWDKPDLTAEELDAYLNLSADVVNYTRMQADLDNLAVIRDQSLSDSENKKLSMSIVESIGKMYGEMDSNLKRQEKTRESLQGKRKDRMEGKIRESASVIQLVEAWREKEKRDRLIKLGELRKKVVKDEIDRIDNLDIIKAEIFGLNKESYD